MDIMNYENACNILSIDVNEKIFEKDIKKQYKRMALKYHPDKNHADNSHEQFNNIKEAYEYLMKYEGYFDLDENDVNEDNCAGINESSYSKILMSFINTIVSEENNDNTIIKSILNKICNVCENKAYEVLSHLDKITLMKIYDILLKYRDVLTFDLKIIDKIKDMIIDKSVTDERIILNPSIDDLFEEKLYKLVHNENNFYVPLWHNEVIYDISGNKLYVSCNPELPEHMTIDDNNNLHVHVKYHISEIYNKDSILINIGKKNIPLPIKNLYIKDVQIIKYANIGIPMAKAKNVYDTSKRCDILLHINIIFV